MSIKKKTKKHYYGMSLILLLAIFVSMFGAVRAESAGPAKPVVSLDKRTKTTAKIKINKQSNVSGYQVWMKTSKNGKFNLVMGIKTTSYTIKKLKANQTYYVRVRAFRTKGVRITFGKYSSTIKISPYKKPNPAPTVSPQPSETQEPTVSPEPSETSEPTAAPDVSEQYIQKVLELVNVERKNEGLSELQLDSTLCQAAEVRAKEISVLFEHTRPNGTQCFTAMDELGYRYMAAGENIAAGQATPEKVVDSWMHSEGHRANILSSSFSRIGIGYYALSNDIYGHYWVQMFSD